MLGSFKEWESTKITNEEEVEWNASLKELESLKKLTCLEIEINNIELLKENMSLPESMVKYEISIGTRYRFIHNEKAVSSYPCLLTKHNHCFRSWIHKFVSAAEKLYLDGDWSSKFIPSDCFGSMVKTLQIRNGKELASLVKMSRTSTNLKEGGVFPVLECMKLTNLPDITYLCDGPTQNGSISFRHLRELKLENLPSLTQLLQDPNQNVTFNKLSNVDISECNELRNLFLLEKTEDAVSELKELVISKCEKMEQVFLIEKKEQVGKKYNLTFSKLVKMKIGKMPNLMTIGKGIESIDFPSLSKFYLFDCPKFKWIDARDGCNNDEYSLHYFCNEKVAFGNLKELRIQEFDIARSLWCKQTRPQNFRALERLTIKECHTIKIFCSFSMVKNFINLKNLSIEQCDHLEYMIGVEKQTHHNSTRSNEILEGFSENEGDGGIQPFPKLESLEFVLLNNFKSLSEEAGIFELHMLHSLTIGGCPKLKESDQNLTDGCKIDNDSLHLFCGKQATFGMLKALKFQEYDSVRSLWCQQISPEFFRALEKLTIDGCHNIRTFCSFPIAKNFIHLKKLVINNCDNMEYVIGVENQTHHSSTRSSDILKGFSGNEENEDGGTIHLFPKLEILKFGSLKNFKTLSDGTETFKLHMLHSLTIWNCPKFKEIDQNQTDGCNSDNDSLHLFCRKQLPYSSSQLRNLSIEDYDNVSNLWCQQIPPCFFQSLERLYIWHCNKLKSAFPYSVAKHLLTLKMLGIYECKQMELVVSGLENETHEQNSILFPTLESLQLVGLPSLEMFCERGCSLTLPSLDDMMVDFEIIYRKSTNEGVEDWNNLLRQHIISKREEKKSEEEEEDDDDDEGEAEAETLDHSSTTRLDAATNEELHKDELHVNAVPSLSRHGSLTAFEMQPVPVLEQAESSTATMDKMTPEVTCPNQLIEQQGAQHDA